eukprot:TRINITY_DN6317_c0_g1_i2.p1 TRINITY_DN6317_c0_g1~~TRINITY_DN6317_c0_g1_i2.p1  ORF type:complete len:104 (-),score=26.80 TRINITY_DN6317_c0_g1_i2:17-328(-)
MIRSVVTFNYQSPVSKPSTTFKRNVQRSYADVVRVSSGGTKGPLPYWKSRQLTDAQLAEFGGKRTLKRRLKELNLSDEGDRAVLRRRLKNYLIGDQPGMEKQD